MTEFMCFILFANRFLNKVLNRTGLSMLLLFFYSFEKRFYSVENLVEKPVGEQDKTHEFSLSISDRVLWTVLKNHFENVVLLIWNGTEIISTENSIGTNFCMHSYFILNASPRYTKLHFVHISNSNEITFFCFSIISAEIFFKVQDNI